MAIEISTMPVEISDLQVPTVSNKPVNISDCKTLAALDKFVYKLSGNNRVRFFEDYEKKYKKYQRKEQPETFARSAPKLEANPTELPVTIGAQEKKLPLSSPEIMGSADYTTETEIVVSADSAIERLRKRRKCVAPISQA